MQTSTKKTAQQLRGDATELAVLRYLQAQGLILVQRNFQVRSGEIDLIMLDQHTLVFVEVRHRSQTKYGSATQSVTLSKQKRIISAAGQFLAHNPRFAQYPCRFDVVGITAGQLEWIKSAFEAYS